MNLKESDEKYKGLPSVTAEELYEDAPCGYLSFVADGTIVMINQTLLSWLGYTRSEVLFNKKFQGLLSIGGRMFFETHFFPLIRMQGTVKEVNFDMVRQDKSLLPVLLNVNEVAGSRGDLTVYRATIFDITDRKQYEREIMDARKKAEAATLAKTEFLATVSHEIRTPLNAIAGITNLIQNTPLNDTQKEYVRILKLSSDGLLTLVNDVLDLSKIEKGGLKLEERSFSVKDIALTIIHTLGIRATEKGIALTLEPDADLPDYCIGDPIKLTQILTNLVGNAIKFTAAGSVKLEISIVESDSESVALRFTTRDTGIGIPGDKLEAIFDEFAQASYDVNLNYGGTGLGLTISQKLLQLHNSTIEVKSKEGEGSAFSFVIRYRISHEKPSVERPVLASDKQSALHNIRVLVVDDTPLNIAIVLEYMKRWGVHCDAAGSGAYAVKMVREGNYDVVLMDLHMPELNGYKATEEIRQANLAKQPAIIALSADARKNLTEKIALAGFDGFLAKPFDPDGLLQLLSSSINNTGPESNIEASAVSPQDQEYLTGARKLADVEEAPFIDLSFYIQLTADSGGSLQEVVALTTASFRKFKDQFLLAAHQKEVSAYADLVHKSKIPIHYIQAHALEIAIATVRELIEQEDVAESQLRGGIAELERNFDRVIAGLESASESCS